MLTALEAACDQLVSVINNDSLGNYKFTDARSSRHGFAELKKQCGPKVGHPKLGNSSYVNVILQMFAHVPSLRSEIAKEELKEPPHPETLLPTDVQKWLATQSVYSEAAQLVSLWDEKTVELLAHLIQQGLYVSGSFTRKAQTMMTTEEDRIEAKELEPALKKVHDKIPVQIWKFITSMSELTIAKIQEARNLYLGSPHRLLFHIIKMSGQVTRNLREEAKNVIALTKSLDPQRTRFNVVTQADANEFFVAIDNTWRNFTVLHTNVKSTDFLDFKPLLPTMTKYTPSSTLVIHVDRGIPLSDHKEVTPKTFLLPAQLHALRINPVDIVFGLIGVVFHVGASATFGHTAASRDHPREPVWTVYDDAKVTFNVTYADVFSVKSSLLSMCFYQPIPPNIIALNDSGVIPANYLIYDQSPDARFWDTMVVKDAAAQCRKHNAVETKYRKHLLPLLGVVKPLLALDDVTTIVMPITTLLADPTEFMKTFLRGFLKRCKKYDAVVWGDEPRLRVVFED